MRASRGWAAAARVEAIKVAAAPAIRAKWLRHGGTWFVGVDALPNAPDGSIGGAPLAGPWDAAINTQVPLHPAQLSVVYPGYPKRDEDEPESAHRFRKTRDAAHLDGLHAVGPDKRRFLREPHAWILGIPLNAATASPLAVWEGSHEIMRDAFMTAFAGQPAALWPEIDVTAIYKEARAEVFEVCKRVEVRMQVGQAVIMHRLAIHGVAPWRAGESAQPEGRMIAYFRPLVADTRDWLRAP